MSQQKEKIVIIHFQPLEYYPPVQNIIQFLQDNVKEKNVFVITTAPASEKIQRFIIDSAAIKIITLGISGMNKHKIQRFLHYLYFNTVAFFHLCRILPKKVFYFETLSSFPVYLYKRFINLSADILIHYHEYTSPEAYRNGMTLEKKFHSLEHYLYPQAIWLSHTNHERMSKFIDDIRPVKVREAGILPNYPPASWHKHMAGEKKGNKLRVVYSGALGMDTMYIKEFAEWVESQNGNVQWDIYSQQDGPELNAYLSSLKSINISFKGNVNYRDLPLIFHRYDVGVVLYKGHIANYIYNAPNKLFEYAVCGLDVWFPIQMKSSLQFQTKGTYPKIISLNFDELHNIDINNLTGRAGLTYHPHMFSYEDVLTPLFIRLGNFK